MMRILAVLLAFTLAACGSAAASGPKTSNPPLKQDQKIAKTPDTAEKPAVEQDGATLKFNALGFKLTLPGNGWQGKPLPQDAGSMQFMLFLPHVPVAVFLRPVSSDDLDLKAIAEALHKYIAGSLPAGATGALAQEPSGRWSFTSEESKDDGTKIKVYQGVQEIGSGQKRYLLYAVIAPADAYDANIAGPMSMLDSVAPL